MSVSRLACAFAAILWSVGAARGQSTFGSFVGTVHDQSGAAIPGCVAKITNQGTSAARSAITDESGAYIVVNLEPGTYQVEFQARGFQPVKRNDIELLSRATVRVDINMMVASQTETVNVVAAAEVAINTEVSNVAETKLGRELTDLPVAIASRSSGSTSPITTLTTQPGVETDASGNLSVAGAKPSMLSVTLDGISTTNAKNGAPISELFPSFEGIAEIRVSEVNNTAEFGGISYITTISKGGTNTYHGSLFENHQNSYLNARNTFSSTVPKLVMNDFGGSVGGPVSVPKVYNGKDHTFFFLTYEGLRLPRQTTVIQTIPTTALKSGDLSAYLPKAVKDPLSGNPFPNNLIPASRIAPLSQLVMQDLMSVSPNYGAATSLSNNYRDNFPTSVTDNQGDFRIDRNISPRQTAFARLTYKRRDTQNAPSGAIALGGSVSPEHDSGVSGAYNFIISPHLVNELRGGFSMLNTSTDYNYTADAVVRELGLTLPGPAPFGAASPNFSITGFTGTAAGTTSRSRTSTFQGLDNLTWTKTHHTFKFGGDYRYLRGLYTNVFASSRVGTYTFNNSSVTSGIIGNAFASFLLGVPDNMGLATVQNPDTDGYANSYALYVQDDWKVSRRLTLNYGLRYEYHPMYNDYYHNTGNFLFDSTAVVKGVPVHGAVVIADAATKLIDPNFANSIAPTPILTATQAGIPQSLRYSQKTDFAPRVGFAWRITQDGKTVLRGGYGRFIESLMGSLINAAWAVEASFVGKYTNQLVNGQPLYTFPYPFPSNLALPGTESFQLAGDLHYRDPYVQQWNVTLERDLGFHTGLRITYDGSHGTDLGVTENANQVPANTLGWTQASKGLPYPLLSTIATELNGAWSNYHALTVTANRRFSKGLQFQATYNFAKNLSNGGGANPTAFATEAGGTITDRYNLGLDYGNVAYTRRHRFLSTFLWIIPARSAQPIVNQLVSGWELAGVLTFQTGPYLTVVTSGADPAGANSPNGYTGTVRADSILGVPLYPTNRGPSLWVNPAAFAVPANNIGRFGTSGVGSVLGPGTQVASLSLLRTVRFSERAQLRLGVSAGNLFNHPNYAPPSLTLGTATFGTITSVQSAEAAGSRQIQLTGRIVF